MLHKIIQHKCGKEKSIYIYICLYIIRTSLQQQAARSTLAPPTRFSLTDAIFQNNLRTSSRSATSAIDA